MAKVLPLTYYPNPFLRQKAKPVTHEQLHGKVIQQLILDMAKTMKENNGIGLAAPQVNQGLRIVIINTKDGVLPLVNPVITKKSWKKELGQEGCLSIPEVYGDVKRHLKINIEALDSKGEKIKFTAQGLFARVIQHEIDHIDGILFLDRAKEITEGQDKLKALEKKYGQS